MPKSHLRNTVHLWLRSPSCPLRPLLTLESETCAAVNVVSPIENDSMLGTKIEFPKLKDQGSSVPNEISPCGWYM